MGLAYILGEMKADIRELRGDIGNLRGEIMFVKGTVMGIARGGLKHADSGRADGEEEDTRQD